MTDKIARIGRNDDDEMEAVDSRSIQDHRNEAYQNGWDDGYAEGFALALVPQPQEPTPEAVERAAWQPIETAPKDGTAILAMEEGGDMFRAAWDLESECWSSYCGQPVVYSPDPSHWMPLPELPAALTAPA